MKLYENVYQIHSLFRGRDLFQYLFVGENILLLEAGAAETPETTIFPYLEKLKVKPGDITLVVTTHPDIDHQGGNHVVKRISSRALLSCGCADQPLVEDPRALFALRYNFLKEEHGLGFDPEPTPDAGKPCKVDLCFSGGERIRLSESWELEILHVPGHSHGHLALYDPKHKAAFVGDAIHGRSCPKAGGGAGIPVTYYYVDAYLSTLRYFEALAIEVLYSSHWPTMRGEQIRDFIAESRQTVELFDRVILASLEENPSGLTMRELIDAVSSAVGDWPRDSWDLAMYPVKGHMDRFEAQGQVRAVPDSRPVRWVKN